MHYFRSVLPKGVLPPMKETSCNIFKIAISSKFFGDLMTHLISEYAGKEIKQFLNVSPLTITNLLLWPFKVSSLYIKEWITSWPLEIPNNILTFRTAETSSRLNIIWKLSYRFASKKLSFTKCFQFQKVMKIFFVFLTFLVASNSLFLTKFIEAVI